MTYIRYLGVNVDVGDGLRQDHTKGSFMGIFPIVPHPDPKSQLIHLPNLQNRVSLVIPETAMLCKPRV